MALMKQVVQTADEAGSHAVMEERTCKCGARFTAHKTAGFWSCPACIKVLVDAFWAGWK